MNTTTDNSRLLGVQDRSLLIRDYAARILPTDQMPVPIEPVLMGLFGEVGGIMATAKKYHREGRNYAGHHYAVVDEFGDALWYLTAICRRLNIDIEDVFHSSIEESGHDSAIVATDIPDWPISKSMRPTSLPPLDNALLQLGQAASALMKLSTEQTDARSLLINFAKLYVLSLRLSGVTFGTVAEFNIRKTSGRFLEPDISKLPNFDAEFKEEEQLPDHFEVTISQRASGRSYLSMKGIFLGDPLTDNIRDTDGYRFHDVFHLAHAAVLHWSPVFRALIKHKRKSKPEVDEAQDGGRAIVIEEGLTAWIFSRAKILGFFEGREGLSFDMLKTISQFVAGYEVDQCPLKLWEHAILQGYAAFRELRQHKGGVLIGDRKSRTLVYRPL